MQTPTQPIYENTNSSQYSQTSYTRPLLTKELRKKAKEIILTTAVSNLSEEKTETAEKNPHSSTEDLSLLLTQTITDQTQTQTNITQTSIQSEQNQQQNQNKYQYLNLPTGVDQRQATRIRSDSYWGQFGLAEINCLPNSFSFSCNIALFWELASYTKIFDF